MKAVLLALAARLIALAIPGSSALPPSHPISVRADGAADDLVTATLLEAEHEPALVRAAWVWSFYESSWWANPKGSNDKGGACGVMQVHVAAVVSAGWVPSDWTCAALRKDRVLGYRAGLRVLRRLVDRCGSLRAGLTAYSTTGACPVPGTPPIRVIVERCAVAGC